MDSIFINSGNSKTSDSRTLLFSLTNKINLNKSEYWALSNPRKYYTFTIEKVIQKQ